ncbi:hypothetical protein Ga0061067_103377 [Pannonibacter indicus]|uniref:Uncharacterized protein n=2 Tax=Pannonibacter indicus TaxID=466044 RepID=A0A0K6HVN5_9HYPH|nr:hypothetical protein Ga0061067_103377 [Pannonibacter indicus]
MPANPTPIRPVIPANFLLGTLRLANNAGQYSIEDGQFPSLYFIDNAVNFIRYRPLHRAGFLISEKAGREVYMYAGQWNDNQTIQANLANNTIYSVQLGNNKTTIGNNLLASQANQKSTQQLIAFNAANNPIPMGEETVYINAGPLQGLFFGGSATATNNKYQPLNMLDFRPGAVNGVHRGHTVTMPQAITGFYESRFPGLLTCLMQAGQSKQELTIPLPSTGRSLSIPIRSNVEYFPQTMFDTSNPAQAEVEQQAFLMTMIRSFS